jgi:hypothetical protein
VLSRPDKEERGRLRRLKTRLVRKSWFFEGAQRRVAVNACGCVGLPLPCVTRYQCVDRPKRFASNIDRWT